jgi:serine/threonine protein kinase
MGFIVPSSCRRSSQAPREDSRTSHSIESNDTNSTTSTFVNTSSSSSASSIERIEVPTRVVFSPTTNTSVHPTLVHQQQRQLHRDWKQKSIVRRSAPIIKEQVTNAITNSTFLSQNQYHERIATSIPLFHRGEIRLGIAVGAGGFSNVYQITEFVLDRKISKRCTPDQQNLRIELADQVRNGTVQLVVKHLKCRLAHSSTKDMTRAACDLIMESTYMSALNHPNILAVRGLPVDGINSYDSGEYDGYFIIMDRLDGTLSDEIQHWKRNVQKAPSMKRKADYALQVASALHYLHTSCNIVFRDLKPQNIGFDSNTGTIQLFDFGLCREIPFTDNITGVSMLDMVYEMSGVGTRRYMAPEIINDGQYNVKVDVYSWAMVVLELMTGVKPYANYDMEEHRVAVCQGGERPHIHFHWPLWLQNTLQNSWCESITNRWSMQQIIMYLTESLQANSDGRRTTRHISVLDSPVDVQQINEYMIEPDWLHLPELPDLRSSDDNSNTTASNIIPSIPQRRHTIFPRVERPANLGNDTNSVLYWDTNEQLQHGLTIHGDDGNIEVCSNLIPLTVQPCQPQKRSICSNIIRPRRTNSCIM